MSKMSRFSVYNPKPKQNFNFPPEMTNRERNEWRRERRKKIDEHVRKVRREGTKETSESR